MGLVKLQHLLEGVVTYDITVQDKEGLFVREQYFSSKSQWTSYACVTGITHTRRPGTNTNTHIADIGAN